MDQILVRSAIILFASFTFSFAGFGFSLVAVPLLALLVDTRQAVLFQYPYALAMVIYLAFRARKVLVWREILPLLAGATVGLPIGFGFLQSFPESVLKKTLAGFIIAFVLFSAFSGAAAWLAVVRKRSAGGFLFGLFSGAFQGAYNTGGPPVVMYAISAHEDKLRAKGTMLSMFLYMYLFLLIPYGISNLLNVETMRGSLYCAPAMLVGTWLGGRLFQRVDNALYRKATLFLLFLTSLSLFLRG